MRHAGPTLALILAACSTASACPACRPLVFGRVFDAAFFPILLALLSPLGLILALAPGLARWARRGAPGTRETP